MQENVHRESMHRALMAFLIAIIIGEICFTMWLYREPLGDFWNSEIGKIAWVSSYFNKDELAADTLAVSENDRFAPAIKASIDCGVTVAPNIKKTSTYEGDAVLACLGANAISCEKATGVLNDAIFPTVFEILKDPKSDTCRFNLSYDKNSQLSDANGRKLARQNISCPLSIVKAIDETKNPAVFSVPDTSNAAKYASQIYFYGTLGVFIEKGIDSEKVQSAGCIGDYISTMVAAMAK